MKDTSRKAARRAKNKAIADKLSGKGAAEPMIPEGDKTAFGWALSWYSANTDKKAQKKWAIEYWTAQSKKDYVAVLKKVPEWAFTTYGSACRIKMREQWYDPESPWFAKRTEELLNNYSKYYETETVDTAAKPVVKQKTIQERIAEKAMEIGGEIEGDIDDFCASGYDRKYERKTNIFSMSPQAAKRLLPSYEALLAELEELCGPKKKNDDMYDQLIEGYSHMKKNDQKSFRDFVKQLVTDLRKVSVPKARATRVSKPKLPSQVVKYLKYKVVDEALDVRSVDKTKMVDATEVFLFNTKSRKLQYYVPQDGYLLTVKGTSIVNFDPEKSGQKTIRKPEEIKKLAGSTKLPMRKAFSALKTKALKVNGRVNADCIILGAFL